MFSAVLILTGFWVVSEVLGGTKNDQAVNPGANPRRLPRTLWTIVLVVVGAVFVAGGVLVAFCVIKPDNRHLFEWPIAPYWATLAGTYLGAVGSTERILSPGKPKWKDRLTVVGWCLLLLASGIGIVVTPAATPPAAT